MNIEHLERIVGFEFGKDSRSKLEDLMEEADALDASLPSDMLFVLFKYIDILAMTAQDDEEEGLTPNVEELGARARELRSLINLVSVVAGWDSQPPSLGNRRA